ncbi:MAG: HmuY family protein [Myxococcales bacterium]|nr:HmuY family protein [Myxococcales bacterium]
MPRARRAGVILALCAAAVLGGACAKDEETTPGGGGGTGGVGPQPVCTTPTAVACEDQVILQMNLQPLAAPGLITDTVEGDGFASLVDATAGGFNASPPDSYVYARFTPTGLVKVDLSDEAALASMDWDIAFRRYVVRVNSGNSGPSCVSAARLAGTPAYESVTSVPDNLVYHEDDYFTAEPDCTLIADGTGMPGSPATALSSFWTYPGCVKMTGNVFVVERADGTHVKLTVTHYYNEASQQLCQDTDAVPMSGTGSANIRLRWAFLP